jgi:hypothetical protein
MYKIRFRLYRPKWAFRVVQVASDSEHETRRMQAPEPTRPATSSEKTGTSRHTGHCPHSCLICSNCALSERATEITDVRLYVAAGGFNYGFTTTECSYVSWVSLLSKLVGLKSEAWFRTEFHLWKFCFLQISSSFPYYGRDIDRWKKSVPPYVSS